MNSTQVDFARPFHKEVITVGREPERSVDTLGAFIDERYGPWAREHVGDDAVVRLKADFADWLSEPLGMLSAWRIETWRRDQLESVTQPEIISCRLKALDTCLSKAVEWQLIERNPLQDVSLEADTDHFVELFGGGIGHGYLRDGWAPIGVNWTWTLGKRAVIELPPVSGRTGYILKINIAGIYKRNLQRLVVTINEATVGIVLCRGPASYEFFIPARILNLRDRICIGLKIPDACRPMDHGDSTDKRLLGFRVAKIELRPLTSSHEKKRLQSPAEDNLPSAQEQHSALQEMVSLGFDCEFGFVQRHLGAEPMSLFRWASVPIDKLIDGLEKGFAGLTAHDALDVKVTSEGEFVAEDKVYGFRRHTFVFAQGGVLDRVQRIEYVRVGVLCKTLLEQLHEHNRLFVYHDAGASKLKDIRRLVRALRIYGDNTLLWIVGAPSPGQIGETRKIEQGLIRGYVSGFQTGPIMPASPHLPSWIKVAYEAHQIWSRIREFRDQFRLNKQLQNGRRQ